MFPAMLALKLAASGAGLGPDDVTIGATLGHGAFATVVAAKIGAESVTMKIFKGATGRLQAIREAMALERCAHPSIMGLLDAWFEEPSGRSFLVFPRCVSDLDRYLRQGAGGFTLQGYRLLMRSLCSGVAWIHEQGLAHTDLKPANILMESVPPEFKVFIADLGSCVEAMRPPIPHIRIRRIDILRASCVGIEHPV